jgi:GNAT superfamily N-acetyltransferase
MDSYNIQLIDDAQIASTYRKFTFPLYQKCLENENLNISTIAIGAADLDIPVGLALARVFPDDRSAIVLSIYVTSSYRCKGIGTSLLDRLERELTSRGVIRASLTYTTGQKSIPAFEHLLQKNSWLEPEVQQLICKCNNEILTAPWLEKDYSLPDSFTIFSWADITAQERLLIQQQQTLDPWIPPDLVPFQYEENLERCNSLGVRFQEQVVGWLLTHRTAHDTIRYTCSFIRKDLQGLGRIVPLYIEALKRQSMFLPNSRVTWTVPIFHTSMVNFVKKYLAPYINSLEESKISYKVLSN